MCSFLFDLYLFCLFFKKKITLIIDYFIVFSVIVTTKMNKLIESQMEILTTYYARRFDVWEAWGDLNDVVERHGNQTKYYIYKVYINTREQLSEVATINSFVKWIVKKTIHYIMISIQTIK